MIRIFRIRIRNTGLNNMYVTVHSGKAFSSTVPCRQDRVIEYHDRSLFVCFLS